MKKNTVITEQLARNETAAALEVLQSSIHEKSRETGFVADIGRLKQAIGGEWSGQISLDARLAKGEIDQSEIKEAHDFVGDCYVATTSGASVRCGDERRLLNYEDKDISMFTRRLGPQVFGGSPIQALAYRLTLYATGKPVINGQFRADIQKMAIATKNTGYKLGMHTDTHNLRSGGFGCGALKTSKIQVDKIAADTMTARKVTQTIFGKEFDENLYQLIPEVCAEFNHAHNDYFSGYDVPKVVVKDNEGSNEILDGNHLGISVGFNLVSGTTFHRDHYSAKFEDKLQHFNWDVWYDSLLSTKLFPADRKAQKLYMMFRCAQTGATAPELMDGSLHGLIRSPS